MLRSTTTSLLKDGTRFQSVTKSEYEFDSNGNWTKNTDYEQVTKFGKTFFEPKIITIREINYH
jgi:hypothetical protein